MSGIVFTNAFAAPAPVTGLALFADPATSLVTLSWTASGLAANLFDHYRIERQVGEQPWEFAGEQKAQTDPTFTDEAAPGGVEVRYRVRVSIGSTPFDSTPLDGAIEPQGLWAIVSPGEPVNSRAGLHIQPGATQSEPWDVSFPRPLGRGKPLASQDPRPDDVGRVLSLSILIPFAEKEVSELLFYWQRLPWVIAKDPDGWVGRCKITGWAKTYQPAGTRTGSFQATEI